MPLSESSSPAKRLSKTDRTSSTNSLPRTSPSNKAKMHKMHVAGHGRLHARNPSYNKNLNKLKSIGDDETTSGKVHKKKSQTPSTSPSTTAHIKRNSSTVSLPRTGSKVNVRRNTSNVSLKRNTSHTHVQKTSRPTTPLKKNHSHSSDLDQLAPQADPKFMLDDDDDDDGDEDEWTEESASQSPSVTRQSSMSKRNSGKNISGEGEVKPHNTQSQLVGESGISANLSQGKSQALKVDSGPSRQAVHSRPPDANILTSRLLKKHSSSKLQPQLSSVSATGTPGTHTPPTMADSQNETLAGSSLPDNGISRFINAPSSLSGSTLQIQNSLVQAQQRARTRSSSPRGNDAETIRRIKSSGNLEANRPSAKLDRPDSSHPGRSPPSYTIEPAPIRRGNMTQLRMDLWRGRDAIEPPHGPPPSILDRLPVGELPAEERRTRQWDKAEAEMDYLRRFRNPLVEAARRCSSESKRRDNAWATVDKPKPKSDAESIRRSTAGPELSERAERGRGAGSRPSSRGGARVRFNVGLGNSEELDPHHESGDAIEELLRSLWAGGEMAHAGEG